MAVTTRQGLIDYCLRALGEPVIEINIDDQQVEDRVDDAIEYFRQYHYEGIEKIYLKHVVTQDDITQKSIPIADLVYGITRVFPIVTGTSISQSLFDLQYQMHLHDLYDLSSTSLIHYSMVRSHLALLDFTLNGQPMYRFNRLTNRLYIDEDWQNTIPVGTYVLVECYRALDPAIVPRMYNDSWLKHYLTAQIKMQWGTNLKKFSGLQLPGGVTIDGDRLYQEAVNEIKDLEESLMSKSSPLEFYMG